MEVVEVVCAVLIQNGKYLICRRAPGQSLEGYWEFPGGKILPGESPETALKREIKEELGIEILVKNSLGKSHFRTTGGEGVMEAFLCKVEKGIIQLNVHDQSQWVKVEEMGQYDLAPADLPFAEELQNHLWPLRMKKAMAVREAADLEGALELFHDLFQDYPGEALIPYQIARTLELLAQDKKALPFYAQALELGLKGELRKQVLIGLGSAYRLEKKLDQSLELLERAREEFPDSKEIDLFLALTFYARKEYQKSTSLLLEHIAQTTTEPNVLSYQEALQFFARTLS